MNLRIRQLKDGNFLPEKEVEISSFFGFSKTKSWEPVKVTYGYDSGPDPVTYETEEDAISAIRDYCEKLEDKKIKEKQSKEYKPRYFKSDQFKNIKKYQKLKFN